MKAGDRVGLVSDSRPEWVISDLAVLSAGAVTVPVYPTLSAPQLWFILAESGCRLAVVANAAQVAKLHEVTQGLPDLETVVVIDGEASSDRFRVLGMEDVLALGRQALASEAGAAERYESAARLVRTSDLATIVYTSGTTGDPKGVMLSHGNIMSNVLATTSWIGLTPGTRSSRSCPSATCSSASCSSAASTTASPSTSPRASRRSRATCRR